jgi:TolA-binding protein
MAKTSTTATPAPTATDSSPTPFLTPQRIRMFGIAGAVVLVIGLIVWFVITAGRRKETYAAAALEQAEGAASQGQTGVAVQGYTRVTTMYAGTAAAYEASLGIAKSRLVAGQNELAVTTLTAFLRTNPPVQYASSANTLLGTANENLGKFAAAETVYRKAADLATADYAKAADLMDAARASRLAGKADDAKSLYQQIIQKYPKSGVLSEAQVRLSELTAGQQ